jgi:hypothetical protein
VRAREIGLSTDRVGNQSVNKIDWGFGMLKIEGIKSSTPIYDNKTESKI